MNKTCKICDEKHEGLGFCRKHYRAFKKYGSPFYPKRKTTKGYKYKTKSTCSICDRLVKAKGFCTKHYQNFKITGDPFGKTRISRAQNCLVSFLDLVEAIPISSSGCKIWPLGINGSGYGVYSIDNVTYATHRLIYNTLIEGFIGDGLVVRHKCDNRSCCNIEHLEIGTQRDNIMDIKKRNRGLFGRYT